MSDSFNPDAYLASQRTNSPQESNVSEFDPDAYLDEAKYGSTGQQIKAGLEGVFQGVAGPVATAAEVGLGVNPEDIRKRAEVNPVTHGTSEAAGFVGSLFIPFLGEENALTKLPTLASTSAKVGEGAAKLMGLGEAATTGAKIAAAGVKSAAEMAALQSADELSKTIENDPNQSLGSAAINIGLSGIIGGAGGAALGAVGPMWKAIVGNKADGFLNLLKNKADGAGLPVSTTFEKFIENAEADGIKIAPEVKARLSEDPGAIKLFQTLRESGSTSAEALNQTIEAANQTAKDQIVKTIGGGTEGISAFEAGEQAKSSILQKAEALNENVQNQYAAIGDAKIIQVPDEARLKSYDKLIEQGQNFGANGSPEQQLFKIYGERMLAQDTIGQLDKLVTEINGKMNIAYRAGDTETSKALGEIKDHIRDFQDQQIGKAVADVAKPLPSKSPVREMYNRTIEEAGQAPYQDIAKEVINARQEARRTYAEFMDKLSDMASLGKAGKIKNYSQFEEKMQSIPSAKLADRIFDKKNIEKLRGLKEEHPDIFQTIVKQQKSDLIESASKTGEINHNTVLNKINSLPKEVKALMFTPEELKSIDSAAQTIRTLNTRLNPSGTAGTLDKLWSHMPAGIGAMLSMVTGHGVIGGALLGEATKFLGKDAPDMVKLALLKSLGHEGPIESSAVKGMADYFKSIKKGQNLLESATKNIFKGNAEVIPRQFLPDDKSREKLNKSIEHYNSNPQAMMNVGDGISNYLPNHAVATAAMTASAVNYLNDLKPKQIVNNPLDNAPPVDKAAGAKYNRALDIAQQPLMVLQHIKNGTLLPQDVQTLNAIYPKLKEKLISSLGQELIHAKDSGEKISYQKKQGLSLLMGIPLDSTMTQASMQAIMSTVKSHNQPQQQAAAKPNTQTMKAADKVNEMYATPQQARALHRKQG